jgi:hypothetical protein
MTDQMERMPVGPRGVDTRTWPCAGCDGRVYRSVTTRAGDGYRHVDPLGFTHCPGHYGDDNYRARPREHTDD